MNHLLDDARRYTKEYIRLRKETNQLLREGKIDKREADHRNGNAEQFIMFARFQRNTARELDTAKAAVRT